MVELARNRPDRGVATYHVVHHRDVTVADVQRAFRGIFPPFTLVQGQPTRMTELEVEARDHMAVLAPGFRPYLEHHRRYDDSHVRKVLGTPSGTAQIDADYLLSSLRKSPPVPETTR